MTYTFAVSRRSLPVRCLCVLLCLLVLWCFFMTPRAGAVVAEAELAYWGGAIVVSVLAAGGLALASGDAAKIGPAMYTALKDTGGKAWDSIQAMAAWAASAGSKVKDAAFRVGKDVWQAITDCFNKSYSDGSFVLPSGSPITVSDTLTKYEWGEDTALANAVESLFVWGKSCTYIFDTSNGKVSWSLVFDGDKLYRNGDLISFPVSDGCHFDYTLGFSRWTNKPFFRVRARNDVSCLTYELVPQVDAPFTLSVSDSVVLPAPDLVYPGDDYLVKAPDLPAVDTATGAVSWPSDAIYNKDAIAVPYPVDAAGEKVADIPFDVPVDQTTGKTLDDADIGTDTKPGEDTDAGASTAGLIGSIIELLKNFFDSPSDFKLNFDGFKNLILPDRFPFSIPFDMVKAVKLFAAAAADFVFRIDLDTQYFSVHHTVDLTPYAVPIAFFRYACVFWFAWILISRTHDLIKW